MTENAKIQRAIGKLMKSAQYNTQIKNKKLKMKEQSKKNKS